MTVPDPGLSPGSGADSGGIRPVDEHLVLATAVLPAVEQLAAGLTRDGAAGHELARLAAVRQLAELADQLTDTAVRAAAAGGATYADLAVALGISEEAVRSRFSGATATSAAFKVAR